MLNFCRARVTWHDTTRRFAGDLVFALIMVTEIAGAMVSKLHSDYNCLKTKLGLSCRFQKNKLHPQDTK